MAVLCAAAANHAVEEGGAAAELAADAWKDFSHWYQI